MTLAGASTQTMSASPEPCRKQRSGLGPHSCLSPYTSRTLSTSWRSSTSEANRLYCSLTTSRYVQLKEATAVSSGFTGLPQLERISAGMCERSSRSAGESRLTSVVPAAAAELPWLRVRCLTAAVGPETATAEVATDV